MSNKDLDRLYILKKVQDKEFTQAIAQLGERQNRKMERYFQSCTKKII